jgi:hypothetical protein
VESHAAERRFAQPGEIRISATVQIQVQRKLDFEYEHLGDRTVKTIPDQVDSTQLYTTEGGHECDWTARSPS